MTVTPLPTRFVPEVAVTPGPAAGEATLHLEDVADPALLLDGAAALLGRLSARHPAATTLVLAGAGWAAVAAGLCARGLALRDPAGRLVLPVDLLWQQPAAWAMQVPPVPYPYRPVLSGAFRHPQRPPKPESELYRRFVPWLGLDISFRAASLEADLDLVHRWMNDPRVAAIWEEAGPIDHHRAYLSGLIADPHMIPMIGCFGDRPFGYFEIYWAKENRIAPFYDAQDYDRGWHVLVGDDSCRGRQYVAAWLPSLMHYLFLDDPRTTRIVGEPRSDHSQQLRNLDRGGFARVKDFDFPHKRATLVMLLRERFFGDRLWLPDFATARPDSWPAAATTPEPRTIAR